MRTEAEVRQALADLLARSKTLQYGAMHDVIEDYILFARWVLEEHTTPQEKSMAWYMTKLRSWAENHPVSDPDDDTDHDDDSDSDDDPDATPIVIDEPGGEG